MSQFKIFLLVLFSIILTTYQKAVDAKTVDVDIPDEMYDLLRSSWTSLCEELNECIESSDKYEERKHDRDIFRQCSKGKGLAKVVEEKQKGLAVGDIEKCCKDAGINEDYIPDTYLTIEQCLEK